MGIELNAGNTALWAANQRVAMQMTPTHITVTSKQSSSTPGVTTTVYLRASARYSAVVRGRRIGPARAFVWITDLLTKKRLVPNYALLSARSDVLTEVKFTTPASANEYVPIGVGVLFTGPPACDDRFVLQSINIDECAPPPPPPPQHHYTPHAELRVRRRRRRRGGSSSSSSSSSSGSGRGSGSSSDGGGDVEHHYEEEEPATKAGGGAGASYPPSSDDPYYSCSHPGDCGGEFDAGHDHHYAGAAGAAGAAVPPTAHSHPPPDSIHDLQSSLTAMIGKLDAQQQ